MRLRLRADMPARISLRQIGVDRPETKLDVYEGVGGSSVRHSSIPAKSVRVTLRVSQPTWDAFSRETIAGTEFPAYKNGISILEFSYFVHLLALRWACEK
jgi:hypothetical protein